MFDGATARLPTKSGHGVAERVLDRDGQPEDLAGGDGGRGGEVTTICDAAAAVTLKFSEPQDAGARPRLVAWSV